MILKIKMADFMYKFWMSLSAKMENLSKMAKDKANKSIQEDKNGE